MIAAAYATGRKKAAIETRRSLKNFPEELPFSNEEIFGEDLPRVFPRR